MSAVVLWFTGLSGSGKTTIAEKVFSVLQENGKRILLLDGDVIRNTIHNNLTFTPADIKENNRRIVDLCLANMECYDYILVPVISPFRESRYYAKQALRPYFLEIYIKADIKECISRDVKGLYQKAIQGQIKNFIGISPNTPYEPPLSADLTIYTQNMSVEESSFMLLQFIKNRREVNEQR